MSKVYAGLSFVTLAASFGATLAGDTALAIGLFVIGITAFVCMTLTEQ